MDNRIWKTVVAHAEALVAPRVCDDLPDAELLRRFIQQKDDASFSAIVRRHGPLVWGVCRHLAANECDAEDAYQASFLALFRHAHRIRQPNALGSWLHGVAGRVCRNSLRALSRRKQHERQAAVSEMTNPIGSEAWDHWHHAVHREIERLPEALRVPFVMCILQGVPQAQAAERLGWKLGTLSGRIHKAKQALMQALDRQGLTGATLATVTIGCGTFCEPLSARLAEKTLVASFNGSGPSLAPAIYQLAQGATGGFMNQMKWLAVTTAAGVALMGAGGFYYAKVDAQSKQPGSPPAATPGSTGAAGSTASGANSAPDPAVAGGMPGGGVRSRSAAAPKVEYRFLPYTPRQDEFKKTLIKQGEEGWEYVGTTPPNPNLASSTAGVEFIFKQVTRGGSGGGVAGTGVMGGMGSPGMPGLPGGMAPGAGAAGGFGGTAPGGTGGSSGSGGFGMGASGGGAMMGGMPGGMTGAKPPVKNKGPEKITLRLGEMMWLEFPDGVKRLYSSHPMFIEANLDSNNPRRVVVKAVALGTGRLEISTGYTQAPEQFDFTVKGD